MIKHIAFTAYPVADLTRARDFYENVLGLKPAESLGDFWQEYDLDTGTFAIIQYNDDTPDFWKQKGASIAFEVDDIKADVTRLKEQGITVEIEPMEFPNCMLACIQDPDGNIISLHQIKSS